MSERVKDISTAHNSAKLGDIAKTVLMPGDPLRAKHIAKTFLEDIVCFNTVRNMLGFTGTYKGVKISVMGSGMGMPSVGIYSNELYKFYDVENIIRVGSCGAYSADLNVFDIVVADSAYSPSTYALMQSGYDKDIIYPTKELNDKIVKKAEELGLQAHLERIVSSDCFYMEGGEHLKKYLGKLEAMDVKAVEMEAFALFANANLLGKNAACILTVSDSFVTGVEVSAEERQSAFVNMMKLGLETAISL